MKCEQFEALLHSWLDGELDEETQRQAEEHTRQCAACARRKRTLEEFLAMCDDMGTEEVVPEAAARAWRQAIRQEAALGEGMAQSGRHRRVAPAWRTWATVAASIILWMGGTVLVHNSPLGTGYRQAENTPSLYGETMMNKASQSTVPEPAAQPFAQLLAPEADLSEVEEPGEALQDAEDSASTGEAPRAYAAMPEQEDAGAPLTRAMIEPATGWVGDAQASADTIAAQEADWRGYLQDAGVFLLMCLPVVALVVGITRFVRNPRRKNKP